MFIALDKDASHYEILRSLRGPVPGGLAGQVTSRHVVRHAWGRAGLLLLLLTWPAAAVVLGAVTCSGGVYEESALEE